MRSHLVEITSKITAIAKSGSISRARKLFDELLHRDTIAWNAMVSGYLHLGLYQEAQSLFNSMRSSNVKPDHFTCTAVLSTCAALKDYKSGEMLHALVVVSGCNLSMPVNNALIDMYGKCLRAREANAVFSEMERRDEVSWCSLLFAYSNDGFLEESRSVFHDMPVKVVIAWNTIIAGYAKKGKVQWCLCFFKKMLEESFSPDQWTLSAVLNACVETSEPCYGRMLHGFIIKSGWSSAVEVSNSAISFYTNIGEKHEVLEVVQAVGMCSDVSWNAIIDAYMKIGDLHEAHLVFQHMPEKNLISWTSMISGYMRNGRGECALTYFIDMMRNRIRPDDIALGATLHACSNLAMLGHGRMVHGCVIRYGFHAQAYVGNGLVNMYGKCGDICSSYRAFAEISEKDLISWNTMLFAFGLHGHSSQALGILEEMVASGMKPDNVTFIGLLMTCNHLGLINEGHFFFESMTSRYGVSPEIEHVACVVDMLGRAGQLERAKEIADKYAESKNVSVGSLEALFGSYSSQGCVKMGAEIAEQLQLVKPGDEMSYVVLSNMYSASGQWRRAETLRKAMADRGIKKMPGCSWVEVSNQVAAFVAGSNSCLYKDDMHMMLSVLGFDMRFPMSFLFIWDGIT
ncbi:pentatricopeptide repeat-containing protein, mitochondrial isoform X1 [Salvia divinorum]|uniref:Pentatricopeptide repeat-containing protein, mitochondrial isoform X1 n=1 Tax=Salvia divinorum TaxID=28513 RepID=A0ABD1H0I5_SALDI